MISGNESAESSSFTPLMHFYTLGTYSADEMIGISKNSSNYLYRTLSQIHKSEGEEGLL